MPEALYEDPAAMRDRWQHVLVTNTPQVKGDGTTDFSVSAADAPRVDSGDSEREKDSTARPSGRITGLDGKRAVPPGNDGLQWSARLGM
jgi:hypothetical protein